ncbi:HAMP domain-containing sensor histidine kinase [Zwartia sp.]|uniref:sensor histidine kinase n=1 Tax=Zwartia sp. TaxID=2978004 RepID=UPI00271A6276|nr:HAMP domain-containing sensor histidine kinase [Zwartia sp.]MDO9024173.1 HAMP domain-containing sensor histidine kinase [Zwartia sp.]
MNIDIASLYLIVALLFFLLPVGVYFATSELRDRQVYWWCLGGVGNCFGFLLIGMRGAVPDFFSFYVAHFFFVLGFSFRSLSLRLETSTNIYRTGMNYVYVGAVYLVVFSFMVYTDVREYYRLNWVHLYLILMSVDLLVVSQSIYGKLKNKGGKLIAAMAIFILIGLLVRMVGYTTELGGIGVFDRAMDQYIGVFLLMIGYVLGNFGFIQLRMQKLWDNKKAVDIQLADTRDKNQSLEDILEEKNSLMRTLSLSAKANSMGTMLGAIAHEINQPLGAIRINTELLMKLNTQPELHENFQETLEHILQDNQRAAEVVSSLRKFFIQGSRDFVSLDFSELVRDVHLIALPEAQLRNVQLPAEIESGLMVKGDQNQLQMVVLNLINNAMDAVADVSSEKIVLIKIFRDNDKVILEVSDNGPGVPGDRVASIFELFNTTKHKGMGMGLWLSRAIMDSHQGEISLSSGPGGETLFRVSLPGLPRFASSDHQPTQAIASVAQAQA